MGGQDIYNRFEFLSCFPLPSKYPSMQVQEYIPPGPMTLHIESILEELSPLAS